MFSKNNAFIFSLSLRNLFRPLPPNSWKSLSNSVAKQNKSLDYRATKQEIRYVATRNAQSRGRSEHKEIKMIITSEADIMFDVLTG